MRWRRPASRLPLTGVAVAGAVLGHMVAYLLAVPSPTVRVALLGATGHAYWTAAIAAASVLGLASVAVSLRRRFRAGLLDGRLLVIGVLVQTAIALALAVLVTLAGRAAEAAGRVLQRQHSTKGAT